MVLALAGDSTMTRFLPRGASLGRPEVQRPEYSMPYAGGQSDAEWGQRRCLGNRAGRLPVVPVDNPQERSQATRCVPCAAL